MKILPSNVYPITEEINDYDLEYAYVVDEESRRQEIEKQKDKVAEYRLRKKDLDFDHFTLDTKSPIE